jgi:hypothetical protein
LHSFIHKTPETFDSKNESVNNSKISENEVSFYLKPLGNKKLEMTSTSDINRDSKLTLAYNIENDKLRIVKSVSNNGSVILTNAL